MHLPRNHAGTPQYLIKNTDVTNICVCRPCSLLSTGKDGVSVATKCSHSHLQSPKLFPQLLIASPVPCISLDDFCLVCKWIQVLSQRMGPSIVLNLALSKDPSRALTSVPSWQSPFWFGNPATSDTKLLVRMLLTCYGALLGLCPASVWKRNCWKKYWGRAFLVLYSDEGWWWTSTVSKGFLESLSYPGKKRAVLLVSNFFFFLLIYFSAVFWRDRIS